MIASYATGDFASIAVGGEEGPATAMAGSPEPLAPGGDAAESLSGEKLEKGYSAYIPALEAAHKVGSKVVHELVSGWAKYENEIPGK